MKVYGVVVGCLSLSSEDGSGLRVRAKLIPASPPPAALSSVLSGGKCNPRLAGPLPGSTVSLIPPSPPPSIHFLAANCWDYEEKCCSTRPDATVGATGCLWSRTHTDAQSEKADQKSTLKATLITILEQITFEKDDVAVFFFSNYNTSIYPGGNGRVVIFFF